MRTHVLVPRRRAAAARPPALDLFRDFDRILGGFWSAAGAPTTVVPRMDVRESEDAIVVAADLPGMEESDIEVSLEDGVLGIRGERRSECEEESAETAFRHVERRHGRFERAFRLPAEVEEDAVTARYTNGVLTVTLPKAAEPQPEVREIPVTAA